MPSDEIFISGRPSDSGSNKIIGTRIIIEGRVQKVGLRHWLKQQAVRLGVFGWVRNKTSGEVEAFLYGKEDDVKEIIKSCHQGSSFAHVKRIKEFPQKNVDNKPREFIILPTT